MNKIEYKIVSIPDKIILDENAIYNFGVIPYNEDAIINDKEINISLVSTREIDRLNNVINELEKYIKTEIPEEEFVNSEWYVNILNKLKELKEDK